MLLMWSLDSCLVSIPFGQLKPVDLPMPVYSMAFVWLLYTISLARTILDQI